VRYSTIGSRALPDAIEAVYFALNAQDDISRIRKTNVTHVGRFLQTRKQPYLLRIYNKYMVTGDALRSGWSELAADLYVDLSALINQLLSFEIQQWGHYDETRSLLDIIAANSRRPHFIEDLRHSELDLNKLVQRIDHQAATRFADFMTSLG